MKISFSTLSCPDWRYEKVLSEAKALGFDGIEIRGIAGEMLLPNIEAFRNENLKSTMEELKSLGLEICSLDSSTRFHDPELYDKYIKEGEETIDLASKMGVKYIRVFGDKIPDPEKADEVTQAIVRGINHLCDYAKGKNVMVLLETHGDFADLKTLKPILEGTKRPEFGILWDIEHTFKIYGDDVETFYNKVGHLIKHVHIKDAKKLGNEFKLCGIGEGDVPIKKVLEILNQNNFEGYVSLEWEKKWKPELDEPEIAIPFFKKYMDNLLNP